MALRGFRQSGEFKESKGFGVAGAGLRDEKQKEKGRQAGKELKEALQRGKTNIKGTEYTGKLADAMRTANIDQFNRRQLSRRAAEESPRPSIMQGIRGLTSQLSPQRVIGSLIGNALLPGIGGLLGGIIGGTYADDDPSNNFFGNIGASLRKDITDTINFFRPEQFVTPPLTESTPSMFPIQNVTETTGMPGMEQIPDMFPDNFGVPTFTPEAAGFGIDSLMQPQQITINPGMGVDVVTYGDGLPVTYGTSPDDPMQGGFIGYSGTGPISVDFDTMGQPLTQRQMEILRRN